MQKWLFAIAFGIALGAVDPIEPRCHLAGKGRFKVAGQWELLAGKAFVAGIKNSTVAAPEPKRKQSFSKCALPKGLIQGPCYRIVQALGGLHVRQ